MKLLVFALSHFAALSLLMLTSYVIGRRLTRSLAYASAWEGVAFCTGLGLGAVAYLAFLLGVLGILYPPVVLVALLLILVLCYPVWRELPVRVMFGVRGIRRRDIAIIALIIVALALSPIWRLPLYPPTTFDETMYHLAVGKIYVLHHALVMAPYIRFPLFPQTNELLFAVMLMLYDDIAAQLVQFLMMLMIAVALFAWGHRIFSVRSGLWAAALWLANPLVLWLGASGLIDLGLTLFVTLGTYAFSNWVQTKKPGWIVLCGAMCGLAAGSKYSGLFFMGVFGLACLALNLYQGSRARTLGSAVAAPVLFGAAALLVAAPWYVRNILLAGNPVEPFLPQVFGYALWNRADYAIQIKDWEIRGMGKNLSALVLLPWNLTLHQERFGNDPPLFPAFFLAAPVALILSVRQGKVVALMCLAAAYTFFWFYTAQLVRYLLPVVPVAVLAVAATLDRYLSRALRLDSRSNTASTAIILMVGGLFMVPGLLYAANRVASQGPVPVTPEYREAYISQRRPAYPAHKFLNALRGTDYRVYGLYDEETAYFTDGTHIGNTLGQGRFSDVVEKIGSGESLFSALAGLGADYFLVTHYRRPVNLPEDEFFHAHFKQIYSTDNVQLFEIVK